MNKVNLMVLFSMPRDGICCVVLSAQEHNDKCLSKILITGDCIKPARVHKDKVTLILVKFRAGRPELSSSSS